MNRIFLFASCILFLLYLSNPCCCSAENATSILDLYHLPLEPLDELEGETINCIIQDHQGFLWFGSNNGLHCYDGYHIKTYRFEEDDNTSISSNRINSIVEDDRRGLWVGTGGGGLCLFNRDLENFVRFQHDENMSGTLCNDRVNKLLIDKHRNLWIATDNGLSCLKLDGPDNTNFINYIHNPQDSNSLIINKIVTLVEDSKGILWIATHGGGIVRFDPVKKTFNHINNRGNKEEFWGKIKKSHYLYILSLSIQKTPQKEVLWISSADNQFRIDLAEETFLYFKPESENPIFHHILDQSILFLTEQKFLWVASRTHGMYTFKFDRDSFLTFRSKTDAQIDFTKTNVIFKDNSGNIWFGMRSDGLLVYQPCKNKFPKIPIHINNNPVSVTSIYQENDSLLWVGTDSQGFLKLWLNNDKFSRFPSPYDSSAGIIRFIRPCIYDINRLWIGIWLNMEGFYSFDKKTERLTNYGTQSPKHYFSDTERWDLWSSYYPRRMMFDSEKRLWLGTARGLFDFNPVTKIFKYYIFNPNNPHSISSSEITALAEDKRSRLWVGTLLHGLNRFEEKTNTFHRYRHDPDDSLSLNSNEIKALYCDDDGTLWIGSKNGLNQYDAETNQFLNHKIFSGINIRGILRDRQKTLWLNVDNGVIRWYPEASAYTHFQTADGLYKNQSNEYAFTMNDKGQVLVGGLGGINIIDPQNIVCNPHKPAVVLTDFRIFNQSVIPGPHAPLQKSISEADSIRLNHTHSVFSFEFAALDYANPRKNQYAYIMEGVDPDWVHTDASRRFATYTNLDPGRYTFRVKASNNDGVWNEEGTSIQLTILPPWWQTTWAYGLYSLLAVVLLYGLWRIKVNRLRLQHQMEIEHLNAEKLQEMDAVKRRFFANISHEFRTPLTLILSPVNQLITDTCQGAVQESYRLIRSNARRLLQLVNQLLALSRLEAGQLKLQVCKADIVPFVDRIFNSFLSLAEHRHIDFRFKTKMGSLETYFDPEKLETILNNLLSNAFKFTPEGGEIIVSLQIPNPKHQIPNNHPVLNSKFLILNSNFIEICITNTGPGIAAGELDKIFDRFYQAENSSAAEGTGIGLSLAKDLIELHHGRIDVQSTPGERTVFTITLPADKASYPAGEISEKSVTGTEVTESTTDNVPADPEVRTGPETQSGLPVVLLVEDNDEMRQYLSANLQTRYTVLEAADGKQALAAAARHMPELIISDVMMPEMDGITLCEKLKNDPNTGHIPVILLTARAGHEDKLTALKTGADDYIPKPFELEELITRSDNLIRQRRALRERFRKEALFGLGGVVTSPGDQETVENIQNIIEKNLHNPDYGNANFARDLGMSRAQLHRRLKALCGLPPHEFIRLCRLKKAAVLLQAKAGSVTQVAYEVGFKNISHFSRLFEKQFGIRPSNFS